MSAGDYTLDAALAGGDDDPAFVDIGGGDAVSRARFRAAAADAAKGLIALGLERGDALAVWLPNGLAWLQLLAAAARIGVLIVPISTRYKAPEVRHLLQVSRARAIVTPARFLETDYAAIARSLQAEVPTLEYVWALEHPTAFMPFVHPNSAALGEARDELLCCFSTSGTTGFPKLAAHGHASIARHAVHVARALDFRPGDALLLMLPLFGVFGFMASVAALAGGARVVSLPHFDPEAAARAVAAHRITHVVGADAMLDTMLAIPDTDFSTWRRGVMADFAGLTTAVAEKAVARGIRISGTYGSSECYSLMSFNHWNGDAATLAQSGGVPHDAAIEVRIVDAQTLAPCAPREAGEIQIRGPNVLSAYLNNPEATAKAFTPDGWYRSGDLGHMRAASEGGGFTYLARMGDSLRLRGYLVNPAEIERCLMACAGVSGAQVVGAKITGEGDVAIAYVTGAADLDHAHLLAHCRAHIASFKLPRRIVRVDEFPSINGPNGIKIQKRVLREWAQALVDAA